MNIMIDLETIGTKPGSAITAIGAVKFDKKGIKDKFYMPVDLESSVAVGMKVDGNTLKWWMKQSDEARAHFNDRSAEHINQALLSFSTWAENDGTEIILWGNGAAFDNVILGDGYDLISINRPWKFWNDRCYRTVKALYPSVKMNRVGVHHNAVDDAESQALHLIDIANTYWLEL